MAAQPSDSSDPDFETAEPVRAAQSVRPSGPIKGAVLGDREDPFDAGWKERVVVLGTVFGAITAMLVVGLIYANDATIELLGLIPVSFFVAGKFLPLWGITDQSNFDPWELGLVIWVLDSCTVLLIVYALEAFYRFDRLKRSLERVQSNAGLVLAAYPRIRKAAVIGVVIFVLFPVAGTGAIGGTFLGILLGLHRLILIVAVSAGGLLGGMLMALAATNFGDALLRLREMQQHPTVKYASIAAVVLALVLILFWLNHVYKRALVQVHEQQMAGRRGGS